VKRLRRRIARATQVLYLIGATLAIVALGVYGTHGLDPHEIAAPCIGAAQCAQMGATTPYDFTQKQTADVVAPAAKEIHA
jgi:hypothetical protein